MKQEIESLKIGEEKEISLGFGYYATVSRSSSGDFEVIDNGLDGTKEDHYGPFHSAEEVISLFESWT